MRIGIDATAMPPRLTGAGNYTVNLTRALLDVDAVNEYVVFTNPLYASFFKPRLRLRVMVQPLASRVLRIVWEQTILPLLMHQQRLDVFHSPHYTIPFAAPCATVVTFHDMTFFLYPEMHTTYKKVFFKPMIYMSTRLADAIIADSETTRQDTLRLMDAAPDQVTAVPLGVSTDYAPLNDGAMRADLVARYHLTPQFILCVSVLEPRKNLVTLVRAYKQLVLRGIPHTLVITGRKGWQYEDLFRTVKELGLHDRVIFTGYVPETDLGLLYSAADVFVYPSIYEGFGLPVLEAMACGTPVVTSNISAMPEIVGDAGLLVDPRNVDALADAIQRIVTDRALHTALSALGLARSKFFSWERVARETLAVYERAVQTRRGKTK